MGANSRRRKAVKRLARQYGERVAASATPRNEIVQVLGEIRGHAEAKRLATPNHKPAHVLAKESSAHQYVKGDRALPPLLTPTERRESRKVWKERTNKLRSQGGHYAPTTSGSDLVSGRVLKSKNLATVTTRVDKEYANAVRDLARWKNNANRELGQRRLNPPRPGQYRDGHGNTA